MDSGPIRVLHVDDDREFVDLAAVYLSRECERFDVETATSAAEGMDRLDEAEYDCVVSDYDMPRTDGLAFLEELRAAYPDLPFVLFTGEGSEGIASEAISAGVTDYLRKGSGTEQYELLANRIRNAVGRYHSERALRERLRQLELTLEKTTSVIWEYDPATGDVTWYEGSPELWQFDSRTTVSMADAIEAHVHPDDRDAVREELERAVSKEGAYRVEFRRVTPDGYRWVEARGEIVRDGVADPGRLIAFTTDISERKERTEELELYETMLETVPDGVYALDEDLRYIAVNQGMTDLTGYSREDLIGGHLSLVNDEDVIEAAKRQRERLTADGIDDTVVVAEHPHLTAGDEAVPTEVRFRALPPDDDGSFRGTAGVVRDITDRKDRERELEEYREYTDRLLDAIDDVFFVYDAAGRPQRWNESFAAVTGYSDEELATMNGADLVPADHRERAVERIRTVFETGHARLEAPVLTKDGRTIPYEFAAARVEHPDGEPRLVGIGRDISERKAYERELEATNERLEAFASVVSHDLRNPLNVAEGNVTLAREECDSDRLDAAAAALDRMNALIEDLLTLAREGEVIEDLEAVELTAVIDAAWETVRTAEARLVVETDRTVRADRGRLRQLLENLFWNAVDHAGSDVTITVGDLEDGSGFFVADDGPGIPDAERERVFERGYSTADEGTGFGLAIVEEIAEAHGWTLRLTEAASGGARFEIGDASDA